MQSGKTPSRSSTRGKRRPQKVTTWADAVHDLRQPLQGVALIARALSREISPDERIAAAGRLALVAQSMSAMLDIYTDVAALDNAGTAPRLATIEIDELLAGVVAALQPAATSYGSRLSLARAHGRVRAEPRVAALVVRALLLHAIKHCDGTEIVIDASRRGRFVTIAVVFNGLAPGTALTKSGLIELRPAADAPTRPIVGMGLAMARAGAVHTGGRIKCGGTPNGQQSLSLRLAVA